MMITDVSSKLAKTLCNYTNQEQQEDYVRYGLEIILGGLLKLFIILAISKILGIVDIMLAAFLTFAIFRSFTGGHHYSTYGRCLIVGLITMLLISFGAIKLTNFFTHDHLLALLFLSFIYALFLTYLYAPSNHFYKKITQKQSKKLRHFSFALTIIWAIVIIHLVNINYSVEIILASIIGTMFQITTIHPLSYTIVNKIEKVIERRILKHE